MKAEKPLKRFFGVAISALILVFCLVVTILVIVDSHKRVASTCNYEFHVDIPRPPDQWGNNQGSFSETRTSRIDNVLSAGGASIFFSIVALLLSLVLLILAIALAIEGTDIRLFALYILLNFILIFVLHVTQLIISDLNGKYEVLRWPGRYFRWDNNYNVNVNCWQNKEGEYPTMLGIIGVAAAAAWISTFFHIYWQATLEGANLIEYYSSWFLGLASLIQYGKLGFANLPARFSSRRNVVKVRPSTQEYFVEIEITDRTLNGFRTAFAERLGVPLSAIGKIVKDRDTLIENDWDVSRLDSTCRVEVEVDDNYAVPLVVDNFDNV